eukprot:gene1658-3207_t
MSNSFSGEIDTSDHFGESQYFDENFEEESLPIFQSRSNINKSPVKGKLNISDSYINDKFDDDSMGWQSSPQHKTSNRSVNKTDDEGDRYNDDEFEDEQSMVLSHPRSPTAKVSMEKNKVIRFLEEELEATPVVTTQLKIGTVQFEDDYDNSFEDADEETAAKSTLGKSPGDIHLENTSLSSSERYSEDTPDHEPNLATLLYYRAPESPTATANRVLIEENATPLMEMLHKNTEISRTATNKASHGRGDGRDNNTFHYRGYSKVTLARPRDIRTTETDTTIPSNTPQRHIEKSAVKSHEERSCDVKDSDIIRVLSSLLQNATAVSSQNQEVHSRAMRRAVPIQNLRIHDNTGPIFNDNLLQDEETSNSSNNSYSNKSSSSIPDYDPDYEYGKEFKHIRRLRNSSGVTIPELTPDHDIPRQTISPNHTIPSHDIPSYVPSPQSRTNATPFPASNPSISTDAYEMDIPRVRGTNTRDNEAEARDRDRGNMLPQQRHQQQHIRTVMTPGLARKDRVETTSNVTGTGRGRGTATDDILGGTVRAKPLRRIGPDYSFLKDKSEEVYSTFLSDVIGTKTSCRQRAGQSTTTEEMCMHRVLAEFVQNTFVTGGRVDALTSRMVCEAGEASLKHSP